MILLLAKYNRNNDFDIETECGEKQVGNIHFVSQSYWQYTCRITMASRRFKPPSTRLLVQQPACVNKKNVKAPHYWPFVRGMYSHYKDSVMRTASPFYNIITSHFSSQFFSLVIRSTNRGTTWWIVPRRVINHNGAFDASPNASLPHYCAHSCQWTICIFNILTPTQNDPHLTHWGQDKMAAIFQTTFSNGFSSWKCMNFD